MLISKTGLTHEPIDTERLILLTHREDAGAVATFEGTVRAESDAGGRTLTALDYEAYEDMASEQMAGLRERAIKSHAILDAVIVHRLGHVPLGEASVVVVVSAAHRGAAFDACRWLIDTLKADVPIWKKEIWNDGTTSWSDPLKSSTESPS